MYVDQLLALLSRCLRLDSASLTASLVKWHVSTTLYFCFDLLLRLFAIAVYFNSQHDAILPSCTPDPSLLPLPPLIFLELGDFYSTLDIKIKTFMNQVLLLQVVTFECQVNVRAAL